MGLELTTPGLRVQHSEPTELWGKSITQWKLELLSKYFCNYVTNLCQNREGVAQVAIYSGH